MSEPARNVITADALTVAPELLGLPLARPWRRAAAMAIDGVLVAALSNAPGALFGAAAAYVLFRVSARLPQSAGYLRGPFRLGIRVVGAVLLFAAVNNGFGMLTRRVKGKVLASMSAPTTPQRNAAPAARRGEKGSVKLDGVSGLRLAGEAIAFAGSEDEKTARVRAENLVTALRAQGVADEDIRETLEAMGDESDEKPWLRAAADTVLGRMAASAPERPAADSLALAFASALRAGDTAAVAALRPGLVGALAHDTVARLGDRVAELRGEKKRLTEKVAALTREKEGISFLARVKALLVDDLGLGLGWIGLYFTAAIALWQGRTPGKRLLGIRVIRLNGKPIGWWAAFERFGGYAAGVATGLLGFAQILWQKNRQGVHDKIAETVVIRG